MLRSSTNSPFVDNKTPTPDRANAAYLNQVGDEVNVKYIKPGTGIPSSDMTAAVQASLTAAGTAIQPGAASTVTIAMLAATGTKDATTALHGDGVFRTPAGGNIAAAINAAPSKTTPIDADSVAGIDSATGNGLTRFTFANLKTWLKTYYDSVTTTMSNKTLTAPRFVDNGFIADVNGNEQLAFHTTTAAINQWGMTNSAIGTPPTLAPEGGDANIDAYINGKGVGRVFLNGGHRALTDDEVQTIANKRILSRRVTITSNATPAINTDVTDLFIITGQAVDITSMTSSLTGTPADGDLLWVAIKATATRNMTWGSKFINSTLTLPIVIGTTRINVGLCYDLGASAWQCVDVS